MNKKFEYQITAYDKDHDIYDIIETGPYDTLRPKLEEYQEQCNQDLLRNPYNNEPYDWVFMEPVGSERSCGQILPNNLPY